MARLNHRTHAQKMLRPGLPEQKNSPRTQRCERKHTHTSENVNKSARRYIAPVASTRGSCARASLSVCRVVRINCFCGRARASTLLQTLWVRERTRACVHSCKTRIHTHTHVHECSACAHVHADVLRANAPKLNISPKEIRIDYQCHTSCAGRLHARTNELWQLAGRRRQRQRRRRRPRSGELQPGQKHRTCAHVRSMHAARREINVLANMCACIRCL